MVSTLTRMTQASQKALLLSTRLSLRLLWFNNLNMEFIFQTSNGMADLQPNVGKFGDFCIEATDFDNGDNDAEMVDGQIVEYD